MHELSIRPAAHPGALQERAQNVETARHMPQSMLQDPANGLVAGETIMHAKFDHQMPKPAQLQTLLERAFVGPEQRLLQLWPSCQ